MMNKFLAFTFFFIFSFCLQAQSLNTPQKDSTAHYQNATQAVQEDSSPIAKRTFEKDFKNKYKDSAFVYDSKTVEKNGWDHFKQWLIQVLQRLFQFSNNETSANVASLIIKVIAGLIVIFVIYLIVKAIINKEGQWIFGKDSHKKNILYSDIEKNIHLIDFEKLIEESVQSGKKRIAIRYYYLWLLKTMAKHHYIKWDIEKTNSDYLHELQNSNHKEEFAYLSYLYNYIWYGEFDIDESTFVKAEKRFKKALKTFSNV